jgi:DNA-binding SARP family transcriptional activator
MKPKARLVLTLLGGFDARPHSGSPLALPTRKARALLAYLAVPLGRAHPREKLAALLWGDMPDAQARGNLRQALSRLQKAWAGVAVPGMIFQSDTVALDPSAVEVDVAAFERLLADGRPVALEQAVRQYRGDLLEGLALPEPAFDEWLAAERERLRELVVKALGGLLAHQNTTGATDEALQTARRLLELDPLQEAVHRLVMRLHWQRGRREAALRQYQLCVDLLKRELRAEPEAETRQLHEEILRPALAPQRPPAPTEPATALVGREQEAARFHALLDEVRAGESRVVALVGEAGIGKSRLLEELAALATRRGLLVLSTRLYETEQVLPFGPWVDALRAAGGMANAPEVLGQLSPVLRHDLARVLPELGGGGRAGASRSNPLPVFTALARLIAVVSARRPLAIVLDDFHWADEMSVRLLAFLGRRLSGSATLLAISVGSEGLADTLLLRRTLDELSNEGHLSRLEVAPLSPADTRHLVRQVTAAEVGHEARERVAAQTWRLAEGNPFVVLEAVRAWCAEGGPELDSLSLPERVRRSIVDRLDRLDDRAKQLASVAAVIGHDFDVGLLLRASGLGDDEAVAGFDSLMRNGILRRDGERVGFRYERVREAAAGLLSAPRRALIHRRVAESLEQPSMPDLEAVSTPDRPSPLELGRHYRGGEVWDKALAHFRTAGRLAAARSAYVDTVACYTEALDVCRQAPSSREMEAARVDVQVELGSALHNLGDVEAALSHYRSAEAGAAALGDRGRGAWTVAAASYAHTSLGQQGTATELAHRALATAAGSADHRALWIWVQQSLVRTSYAAGDYQAAISVARATLGTMVGDPADQPVGHGLLTPVVPSIGIRGFLALALSALGQFNDAMAEGAEAVRIAEKVNRSPELAWASYCLGRTVFEHGDVAAAVEHLERAFALTREWEPATRRACTNPRPLAEVAAATLALAHAATGQLASALSLAAAAATAASARPFWFVRLLAIQGAVLLAAQRFDRAASVATAALETARARGERGHEAWALQLLGKIARRQEPGAVEPALTHVEGALALADRLHMRPLRARCRLERAETLLHAGRRDEARQSLRLAIDDFRVMEMKAWVRRAEALGETLDTEREWAIASGRRGRKRTARRPFSQEDDRTIGGSLRGPENGLLAMPSWRPGRRTVSSKS